ncbi:hypothetical protein FA95DRAFT_1000528 [Auriscalpium vulgare]|uniref:Uncharacterized protein n=1 Tax=Auriscalpium vulgare TaxID=40419 RepID=A0ACB8RZ25_9AGAM|nr:hypothetical protein FA95DRAFT_1000528 [Auriscalpium vulgare]
MISRDLGRFLRDEGFGLRSRSRIAGSLSMSSGGPVAAARKTSGSRRATMPPRSASTCPLQSSRGSVDWGRSLWRRCTRRARVAKSGRSSSAVEIATDLSNCRMTSNAIRTPTNSSFNSRSTPSFPPPAFVASHGGLEGRSASE